METGACQLRKDFQLMFQQFKRNRNVKISYPPNQIIGCEYIGTGFIEDTPLYGGIVKDMPGASRNQEYHI